MGERNLYVGLDLDDDFAQLCCFHPNREEILTMGGNPGDPYYLIPTVLGVTKEKKEWLYGDLAMEMAERKEGILVPHLLQGIEEKSTFRIYGTEFDGTALLEKFFRKIFVLLRTYYPSETITKLVVTLPSMRPAWTEAVYEALSKLGILKDRASIKSHEECYVYYALSQKKELWLNDIALFDLNERGLLYQQIHINRKTSPYSVTITEQNFGEALRLEKLKGNRKKKEMAGILEELAEKAMFKQIISTVYMTGAGFLDDWADGTMRKFCTGRRVFKGPNLYSRGACYGARHLKTGEFEQNFLLLGDHIVDSFLYLQVYKDGKVRDLEIIRPGRHFDTFDERITLIVSQEEEIRVLIRKISEKTAAVKILPLENMPLHPDKMFRLELAFRFQDAVTCVVTMRDKGFGDFSPSSFRIWEAKIPLK